MTRDLDWFPELPDKWRQMPLKAVCDYRVSNVDKVPAEDELPVRLCNYTDVYHNEFITPDMELMETTATQGEIDRFGLTVSDVVITKDSEAWNDIGVPAVIAETAPDLVCGYHLAMLRPVPDILDGRYLFRCLQARPMQFQFERSASGVTRYGLGLDAIGRLYLPIPPLPRQRAIAAYLDRETERIDAMIAAKERLLTLLAEKRRALITHTVTRGLNPDAPTKDSGIEWLGEIPEHWKPIKIRWLFRQAKRLGYPDLPPLSVYREYGVILRDSRDDNANRVPQDLDKYQLVESGDLVINKMKAWQGSLGISTMQGITSPDYVVFSPNHEEYPAFLNLLLRIPKLTTVYLSMSNGIRVNQWRLEPDRFITLEVLLPPLDEQVKIVQAVQGATESIDRLREAAEQSIRLLQERRSAIIAAAVTGQIDVEDAA